MRIFKAKSKGKIYEYHVPDGVKITLHVGDPPRVTIRREVVLGAIQKPLPKQVRPDRYGQCPLGYRYSASLNACLRVDPELAPVFVYADVERNHDKELQNKAKLCKNAKSDKQ